MKTTLMAAGLAFTALFATAPAFAEMQKFKGDLKAASEVPANDSKASGTVEATYDTATKKLTYSVAYKDLSGPATAAHYHGPAALEPRQDRAHRTAVGARPVQRECVE